MKRWTWLLSLIPTGLGAALAALLTWFVPGNPIIYLRADLGTFLLFAGLSLSVLTGLLLFFKHRSARGREALRNETANERRRFLRRLDHELKNPLTAIRAGLANLDGSPSDRARQEALLSVDAQAQRLSRLASDLRKLAELEVRLVEHTPVDIPAMLQEVFALTQDQPGASQRRLNLSIPQAPWPLPKVTGDADLLFLAVHNLMENALKFTRPNDTLELHAFEDGTGLVIEVADTGPGIPVEEQPHVFEELYRGEAGRGIPGSGLGLALVKAIAERHGGQVSLRSRPGQGTVFTLRLPVG